MGLVGLESGQERGRNPPDPCKWVGGGNRANSAQRLVTQPFAKKNPPNRRWEGPETAKQENQADNTEIAAQ